MGGFHRSKPMNSDNPIPTLNPMGFRRGRKDKNKPIPRYKLKNPAITGSTGKPLWSIVFYKQKTRKQKALFSRAGGVVKSCVRARTKDTAIYAESACIPTHSGTEAGSTSLPLTCSVTPCILHASQTSKDVGSPHERHSCSTDCGMFGSAKLRSRVIAL